MFLARWRSTPLNAYSYFNGPFYFSNESHYTQAHWRRCGIWNTLPSHVRNIDVPVSHFKKELFNFYLCLSNTVYDVNTLRPIRLCVSSATLVGHWPACLIECVVDRFIDVCPYTICYCLFLWCLYLYIVIIATITIIIIFFFSGPHNGACSVCVKARHLGKVVNK